MCRLCLHDTACRKKKCKTEGNIIFFSFKNQWKASLNFRFRGLEKKKKQQTMKPVCELASHFLGSAIGVRLTSLVLFVLMLLWNLIIQSGGCVKVDQYCFNFKFILLCFSWYGTSITLLCAKLESSSYRERERRDLPPVHLKEMDSSMKVFSARIQDT